MKAQHTVLLTGASKGLGFSIAEKLAHDGCRLILVARNKHALDAAAGRLTNAPEHISLALDLTGSDSAESLAKSLAQMGVVPDVVVHNLGGKVDGDCHPLGIDILRKSMALNLEAAVNINNALIPLMEQRGSGTIIHIGSDAAVTANASPAYSIAKAALSAYIVNIARNHIKDNIVICGVLPGPFEHPDSVWTKKKVSDPACYSTKVQSMPLGRFMNVEEVSEVVCLLCSVSSIAMSGSLLKINASDGNSIATRTPHGT
jgi:NAD(P)-dependent dehydrogenase (short-subunit alcohol dehydrogenase family)